MATKSISPVLRGYFYVRATFLLRVNICTWSRFTHITPEVGAWVIANAISLPTGFILSRHIVYPESNLHGHVQMFRYALTTVFFIVLAYLLVKLFAYSLPALNPTIAYAFICVFIAAVSYVTQRLFTFKILPEEVLAE